MFNREEGIDRMPSPMGYPKALELNNLVSTTTGAVASPVSDAIDRLMTIYNSRAFANPNAPLLSRSSTRSIDPTDISTNQNDMIAALTRDGGRLGFLTRDIADDGIRYGIGIDNMGDPYRGVYDGERNTPVGMLDYGYDGDTVYAGITPTDKVNSYIGALANLLKRRKANDLLNGR